jgi:hypothetical protein
LKKKLISDAGQRAAHVVGLERPARVPDGSIPCVLGRNLVVNPSQLGRYCSGTLNARADDLVVLAGLVAFADRSIKRNTSRTWTRDIHITAPVLEPDFWQQPSICGALRRLLNLLTGDAWHVSFSHRRNALTVEPQSSLGLRSTGIPVVMPYSDGMDSFVVARLLNEFEPNVTLIMVTTGRRRDPDASAEKGARNSHRYRFAVPFKIKSKHFYEASYRSRALIYGAMGSIAAKLAGGCRVVVAESGQGALGPWLAPVGNEAIDVRMNPLYTTKLAEFVGKALEFDISFEHPRLWSTKGQTLQALVDYEGAMGVQDTRSCARDARHMSLDRKHVQCGVCAACLLRRVSMFAAGLEEHPDAYMWSDLRAPTLERASRVGSRATTKNDKDQAVCGALSLQQLADVPLASLTGKAWELHRSIGGTEHQVVSDLRRLVGQHANEWRRFVDAQGPRSFLRQWT